MINNIKRGINMRLNKETLKEELTACAKLRDQGELRRALNRVSKLISLVKKDEITLIKALILKSVILRDVSRPGEALSILEEVLKATKRKRLLREQADIYRQKSYLFVQMGKSADAESLAFESLDIARRASLKTEEANADACIGHVLEDKGDFQGALSWYQEGILICEEVGLWDRKATLLGDIGKVHARTGNLPESFTFLKQALDLAVKIKYEKATISSLYRLGDSYRSIGDEIKAKAFYNQAHDKSMSMGYKREQGDALYGLGQLTLSKQKLDEAKEYFSRALRIFEEMHYLRQVVYCRLAIGHALEQQSRILEALDKYFEALQALPNIFDYTDAYLHIVDDIMSAYFKLGHIKEAQELAGYKKELSESAKLSGVSVNFRKEENMTFAASKIKDIINQMQNIRENIYSVDGLRINFNTNSIKKGEQKIRLTSYQWKILNCLWQKKQQVCTRDELREAIGLKPNLDTRTIDEQIHKIRKNLGTKYILTHRGAGYRLLMPN